jgi:1,4-alpha-glucan branching enzyme
VPRSGYLVGVPAAGSYRELLNSDLAIYGGGDVPNGGAVTADGPAAHGFDVSLRLSVPPLGFLLLKKN